MVPLEANNKDIRDVLAVSQNGNQPLSVSGPLHRDDGLDALISAMMVLNAQVDLLREQLEGYRTTQEERRAASL